ncbi:MAG: tetratricopeptide repeat protein [Acidobacteriota bacterium]
MSSGDDSTQAWYVAEGQRGQHLLDQGQASQATEVFEAILTRLGETPSYARAVILGRLGRCFHIGDRPDLAVRRIQEAIGVIGRLVPGDGVKRLRGTLRSDLGDALRARGQYGEARRAYEAALKIAGELKDLPDQGVALARLGALALAEGKLDEALARQQAALQLFQELHEPEMEAAAWHQLGRVYHQQRRWDDAERHYREAARVSEERGHLAAAAQTWSQLAVCAHDAGNVEAAEDWYRKAIEVNRRIGNPTPLTQCLSNLADLLQNRPGRLADARPLAEEALAVAQHLDPSAAETWKGYGVLADIIDNEARVMAVGDARSALEMQARDYRALSARAPIISAALDRVNNSSSFGRTILLGQLGRCFYLGRRPDLAVACHREAIRLAAALAPGDGVQGLCVALHADLGDMLDALGQNGDARDAYAVSLKIADALQDLNGQAQASQRLGRVFHATPSRVPGWGDRQGRSRQDEAPHFDITLYEELFTDYVFENDLLIDGPRQRRVIAWPEVVKPLSDDVRPVLLPCARTFVDDEGAVRFSLLQGEPIVERHADCTLMRRVRREIAMAGNPRVLWSVIARMDGTNTVADILAGLPAELRSLAARILAALTAVGVVDVSGRPVGRFLHFATKKGVLPAGGLEGDEVLYLATDGQYLAYPDAPRIAVSEGVPDRLRPFHALTRARRSHRDYGGLAIRRADFDALLHTACGVTGSMAWGGRDVKLRAYPSSGALYAVEIYPVVFRVDGLEPAVYHYRAVENALEVVSADIDPSSLVEAALPVERAMVSSAAVLFCLTGCFLRHERKYGEGGYRMLVAETGHISQNLILAATALGLSARPFGGVFDGLLNHDLGLDGSKEQFLLGVLAGNHGDDTASSRSGKKSGTTKGTKVTKKRPL